MRDRLQQGILAQVEDAGVNGDGATRVPNTANIHFDFIDGEAMVIALDLKGIAVPSRAWAALRASSVESRFDALHASGLTALVGREEESELLLRRWGKAKNGEGQVVLLSGEAGIGKSRLTAALLERLADEPHTRLRYFCSPQRTDSALYPIIGQMERAAGFALTPRLILAWPRQARRESAPVPPEGPGAMPTVTLT